MWIELNRVEKVLAQFIASKRHTANRYQGIKNQRIGPQSDEQTDLDGIGAEIAFCKLNNIYPDTSLDRHPFEDAVTKDGRRVDVKATRYHTGHLVAVMGKADMPRPDIYVLVIGSFPRYRIAGWMTSDNVLSQENVKDFGHGPTYAVEQKRLNLWR